MLIDKDMFYKTEQNNLVEMIDEQYQRFNKTAMQTKHKSRSVIKKIIRRSKNNTALSGGPLSPMSPNNLDLWSDQPIDEKVEVTTIKKSRNGNKVIKTENIPENTELAKTRGMTPSMKMIAHANSFDSQKQSKLLESKKFKLLQQNLKDDKAAFLLSNFINFRNVTQVKQIGDYSSE